MTTKYLVDDESQAVLESLREHYDLKSTTEVLRRAVVLLNIAKKYEHPDKSIVFLTSDHREIPINMHVKEED